MADWRLSCPDCRIPLTEEIAGYHCPNCNQIFLMQNGVIRFAKDDSFYEGLYSPLSLNFSPDPTNWLGRLLLYLIGMNYFWFIYKHIPKGSRILDLGCGAGMVFLAQHYKTAGLDVSFSSLTQTSKIYELSLQCEGKRIPLPDGSLDAVVSRFFMEHIPVEEKILVLNECWRVLMPGGWLIILQDCDCNNPLWRWAKRDTELFRRNFIERDGHYGLMLPSQNLVLLEQIGFTIRERFASNKTFLVTPSMIGWMQDYHQKGWLAKILLKLAAPVNNYRMVNLTYSMLMTAWDDLMEGFLPLDHARYLLTACQK